MDKNFLEVSPKSLSRSPHGLAFVTSVDGRGIFSVFGIFQLRKGVQRGVRTIYEFAGALCFVGGKVIDAFLQKDINETQLKTYIQSYIKLASKRVPLARVPAKDVAKLFMTQCFTKQTNSGPFNEDLQEVIEIFKNAGNFASTETEEEFLKSQLGETLKGPKFARLDSRRPEFSSWWIEFSELTHMECPQPDKIKREIVQEKKSKNKEKEDSGQKWRVEVAQRLSVRENYVRFAGIARHMVYWFIYRGGNDKIAATFVVAHCGIFEAHRNGKHLTPENPLLGLFVDKTHLKCDEFGTCFGQTRVPLKLTSSRKTCNLCNTPAEISGRNNLLTCCDDSGNFKLGNELTQAILGNLIYNYNREKLSDEVMLPLEYVLLDALNCFFAHALNSLYWFFKPNGAVVRELVDFLLRSMKQRLCSPLQKLLPVKDVVFKALQQHCATTVPESDLENIANLFAASYDNCLALGEPMLTGPIEGFDAKPEWAFNIALCSRIANSIRQKWKFLSSTDKEKLLSFKREVVTDLVQDTFRKTMAMIVRVRCKEKSMSIKGSSAPFLACQDHRCACHSLSTFQFNFLSNLPTASRAKESHLVYKPSGCGDGEGILTLNSVFYMDDEGDALHEFIRLANEEVWDSIEELCQSFQCERLQFLHYATYRRLVLAFKMKIIQEYGDIQLLPETTILDAAHFRESCGGCGWEENGPERLYLCGGCLGVRYCSSLCQRRHWEEEHRRVCTGEYSDKIKVTEAVVEVN
ncbi:predicted protein [Nematostella vectensis]|uniref:MYND-type domain-containing protein n=1 Tax=Nematostella vectensis TaxID=45351 RepID=A7SQU6_NEMVE|nr:uncharacterized protein LOC5505160 [Nematostella vectensis]EDO33921.1 predicted protein [Nematostella vectensis]|eukprot:XP_001626021.1 predicted protein [Nematostella vectensis]